jgi:hypothetical protein
MREHWVLLLFAVGCGRCDTPAPGATPAPSLSVATRASAPVALPRGPWQEAADGDEAAAMRLSQLYDAPLLFEIAKGQGRHADTALWVLAHADDAELVVGAMAALAAAHADRRDKALDAIAAIAGSAMDLLRGPPGSERLDPDSVAVCVNTLQKMSRDSDVERAHRSKAVSALRSFARHGWVDPASITTALDPQ